MRPPLRRNALLAAAALATAAAMGALGVASLRAAPAPNAAITTEPAVSPHLDQSVFIPPSSIASFPAPPGAPPPLVGPPEAPADPDSDADSDTDSLDRDAPAPPEPVSLQEYLQHGSKEPLVPPVIHVEAKLAPGSVPTEEPLVPPAITVTATPIDPPVGSVAAGAPLVPPVVNVAAPPVPR
jgi:hypothetical protein